MDFLDPRARSRWNSIAALLTMTLVCFYVFMLFAYYNVRNQADFVFHFGNQTSEYSARCSIGQDSSQEEVKASIYTYNNLDLRAVCFLAITIKITESPSDGVFVSCDSLPTIYPPFKRSRDPPVFPL